ncbi:hypothetical protein [Paenibacillus mendelii]|uniref:LysM domain-containing protein n=1 Tax=Paenibacillus mendelii TaxID=206163 RepID=A0ABV6JBR8_9BACL|nr:hypothetical protein [Paenibacillus mendelii]MCQ6562581.1 hypothetical protein [Paenibacillus mendelii]
MNKYLKTMSITAALAVMIPLSAYAATSATTSNIPGDSSIKTKTASEMGHRGGGHGKTGGIVSQEVLDLLKLDQDGLNEKLAAGKTLAQVAEAQSVTREQLKQALTTAFDNRQKEKKSQFTSRLDTMIDSTKPLEGKGSRGRFDFNKVNLDEVAGLLGLSDSELETALTSGKSLADLAKDKGVEVQNVIDALKAAIVNEINQAVEDGQLTQEQAGKQTAGAAERAENIVNGQDHVRGGGHRGGFEGKAPSKSSTSSTTEEDSGSET